MIQIEEIHIEEFRGIRKLSLMLGGRSFCIYGPNGSGKSGVVDAIEFALTGDISRLSGEGTGGISVAKHGAHVDKRDDLDAAFVRLKITVLSSGKSVTITRRLKKPKEPVMTRSSGRDPFSTIAMGVSGALPAASSTFDVCAAVCTPI